MKQQHKKNQLWWCYVTLCDVSPWKSCVELVYLTDYYREATDNSSSITASKIMPAKQYMTYETA